MNTITTKRTLHATFSLTKMQMSLMVRDIGFIFWSLFFPLLMVIIFGETFGNDPNPSLEGSGFLDVLTPGLIAITVSTTAFYYVGVPIIVLRERQVLRRLRITPLPAWSILIAQILSGYLIVLTTSSLIVTASHLMYDVEIEGSILTVWAILTISSISFLALAFIFASVVRSSGMANALANGINMAMMVFSGSILPLALMPERVQEIGRFIPLTYVVELLRDSFFDKALTDDLVAFGVLALCGALGFVFSSLTFRWE